jgi:site-specific DNA-methyltransferase (adenine-specific)
MTTSAPIVDCRTDAAAGGHSPASRGSAPYYQHGLVTIYLSPAEELLESLPACDLLLTDPPYPDYEKGWEIPDVSWVLGNIRAKKKLIFWPCLLAPPLPAPKAEHIWEKPNGRSAHWYEKIYGYGSVQARSKIYRVAAILPNYSQYAAECVNHPCQKPLKLIRKLIQETAPTCITDCFMGSGTTLVAAKEAGIPCIGIDSREEYCEQAAKRLSQEQLNLAQNGKASDAAGRMQKEDENARK